MEIPLASTGYYAWPDYFEFSPVLKNHGSLRAAPVKCCHTPVIMTYPDLGVSEKIFRTDIQAARRFICIIFQSRLMVKILNPLVRGPTGFPRPTVRPQRRLFEAAPIP